MPVSLSGHVPGNARDRRGSAVHDHVALDEIELCCELMIAASTATTERLSAARIDEVLRVAARAGGAEADAAPPPGAHRPRGPAAQVPCQRRRH